jgi:hypothetical protein
MGFEELRDKRGREVHDEALVGLVAVFSEFECRVRGDSEEIATNIEEWSRFDSVPDRFEMGDLVFVCGLEVSDH